MSRFLKQKHFNSILFYCQVADALSRLYGSPDEVDLFIGGISEKPLPGAVLGPTFVCIVGDQFSRLRRGDRFFYEEATARFTEGMENFQNVVVALKYDLKYKLNFCLFCSST